MKILKFDGASRGNPGIASSAAVLFESGIVIKDTYQRLSGKRTNNQAEYLGLIAGLRMALSIGIIELQVEGDSKLVIEQLFGNWQCRHPVLKKYYQTAKELLKQFQFINGRWIPREQNKEADAYCNYALDKGLKSGEDKWFTIDNDIPSKSSLFQFVEVKSVSKFP